MLGNPVDHSLSPRIHELFARQFGLPLDYRRIHVDVGGFNQAVDSFRAARGQGVNVTVPFKIQAFELSDERSDRARAAGAANTLSFRDDRVHADNTDGVGVCRDISDNLGFEILDRNVLILGAGGAVRGMLGPLIEARPAAITLVNRTVAKAGLLAELFERHGRIESGGYALLPGRSFDLVVNGTAASLRGELPPLPDKLFNDGALAYDMMYGPERTPFLRWAADHGAVALADGLGMLVEQAAESFFIWHQRRPDTAAVIQKL
ncbi:MAG: shikimate dehydrogenase [Sinobacteraceae bacterium]|nr:shikimate dehydrogenase [Nevskiaceae bacterium]